VRSTGKRGTVGTEHCSVPTKALKGRNTYFALTGLKDNTLVFLLIPSALRWAKIRRPFGAEMLCLIVL